MVLHMVTEILLCYGGMRIMELNDWMIEWGEMAGRGPPYIACGAPSELPQGVT